jgi:exosome complex component RRP42
MVEEIISEITRDYIEKLVEQGMRIDNRGFDEYRKVEIKTGIITTAEGSAQVNIGDTTVISGIKMDVAEPYADSPDMGVLTVNAELIPLASPTFEPGPPSEDAIELARVVDRGIREAEAIDLRALCIEEYKRVWLVYVDIHVLDYDGNLFDTAALASIAALMNTQVPALKYDLGEDYKLPIQHYPVACTSVKISNKILLDPNLGEEKIADARLTITTDENGDIRAIQKGLKGSFKYDEILQLIDIVQTRGTELRQKLFSKE